MQHRVRVKSSRHPTPTWDLSHFRESPNGAVRRPLAADRLHKHGSVGQRLFLSVRGTVGLVRPIAQLAVDVSVLPTHLVNVKEFDCPFPRIVPKFPRMCATSGLTHRPGKTGRGMFSNQPTRFIVLDDLGYAASRKCDGRPPHGGGFDHGEPKALLPCAVDHRIAL